MVEKQTGEVNTEEGQEAASSAGVRTATRSTPPKSLRILPDRAPLYGDSPFLDSEPWQQRDGNYPPRALRSLAKIVDQGLCHRCGSCVGICPTNVLSLNQDAYPQVTSLSSCTDCDLCVRVCPGDEFQYDHYHQELFGEPAKLQGTHGYFKDALLAHALDETLREKSTSGGLVTAIILHMIDSGQVDGAVVVASDDEHLWKGKPVIARTREEVLAATKSKYAISPTNSVFKEILQYEGRYVLVGLPCQIHGFLKAAELDERLKERVVLTLGLFCHAAIEHEAFRVIWESLGEKGDEAVQFVSRLGKHPGSPHIELKDGSFYPVYFGHKNGYQPSSMEVINILYRLYTPRRCMTCFDALADFADISVGDPWMVPPEDDIDFYKGWSFGLIRSDRGAKAIAEMIDKGRILKRALTRQEALSCNEHMSTEKRTRAFRVIEAQRRLGKSIPSYGDPGLVMPKLTWKQLLKVEVNIFTHIFCFIPSFRRALLNFFLGDGGYALLWLNNKRRRLKYWMRKTVSTVKRKVYGRK